ncbi:MAG TPA: phospholipid carrier-dependent glycosyltransferase [Anaerolineales bacterium]|nr:phospholipid carrier-dependent glycosyltransferase [Anaerolineales bacterium]HNB35755.1 phospholipid carrier-dependent glycosyltransferase [Anaerolineales bacterium]HNC07677.1 phospholipid carrier-dependent glycosyltransferase [Anaerolineales bacterium]
MQNKINSFFSRHEFLLPLFIFLLFLAASLPGISWGAPALWNPDELVWRVDQALGGYMQFDVTEPDYNYPSLPKYVMYGIGLITYGMGRETYAFIVAARSFSAFLGALSGVLIYILARTLGAKKTFATLAGILYVVSAEAVTNGRFAHNDLYLQFFTILCVLFIVKYQQTSVQKWLYLSFFAVGLAASCKYTGGSLIILPVVVYLGMNWKGLRVRWLAMAGWLFLGGLVSYLGYGLGTPIAFTDPIHYFSNVIPALRNLTNYGFNAGTVPGLYGQWRVFEDSVGIFCYYFFLAGYLWYAVRWFLEKIRIGSSLPLPASVGILLSVVLIFDLPFLISINYIGRYFIPFIPFMAILSVFFLEEVLRLASSRNLLFVHPALNTLMVLGILYSTLRLVSIALLFLNDARIPATEYIASLRGYQKSIEYTLYPPSVNKKQFMRAHNYPIYFVEWAGDEVPTGGNIEYNQGEQGLLDRDTDYFVLDSFTYDRFYTPSICDTTPVECDFFLRLLDDDVKNYRLLKEFTYELPPYLPKVSLTAVNPKVHIYERVRE